MHFRFGRVRWIEESVEESVEEGVEEGGTGVGSGGAGMNVPRMTLPTPILVWNGLPRSSDESNFLYPFF